ncbi:MAG: hypothetical protein O6920_01225, partial [Chloroflexi bacterium]|nr:hypothetical protein [Chloroflexota bacterium]
ACTCVACEARRSGFKKGREVWRERDVTGDKEPRSGVALGERRSKKRTTHKTSRKGVWLKLFRGLLGIVILSYSVWIGWGIWQDYREYEIIDADRALDISISRTKEIPDRLRELPALLHEELIK